MIESMTKKIMLKGIERFAKEESIEIKESQINISFASQDALRYRMCKNWQPQKEVDFLYILDKKFDLLQREQLATPVLGQSLLYYMEQFKISMENISVFIFAIEKNIGLAVYDRDKNVKTVSLGDHLQLLGL